MFAGIEDVMNDLRRQNAELSELLRNLSNGMFISRILLVMYMHGRSLVLHHVDWRNDCERHHIEIIDQVRATANEQVPFNVQNVCDI